MSSYTPSDPMNRFIPNPTPCGRNRREFLWQIGGGFAGLALTDLLYREATASSPLAPKEPHFPAKAKHCVFLFMNGGPSQVDTFDPKPSWPNFMVRHIKGMPKWARMVDLWDISCNLPSNSNNMAAAVWKSAACFPIRPNTPTTSVSFARCTPTRRRTHRVVCK